MTNQPSQIEELEKLVAQRTALLNLTQTIAAATNKSIRMEDALQIAVDAICKFMSWPVGHVYLYDKRKKALVSSKIWHLDKAKKFIIFKKASEEIEFKPGVGLPGRSFDLKDTVWFKDVTTNDMFLRAKQAADIGVHTGFAIPILVKSEVSAILEFYSDNIIDPDQEMLNNMFHIGSQIGRVIERKRAEDKLLSVRDELEKNMEERTRELALSKERLELCWEGVGDGMWDWNITTNHMILSDNWKKSLGYQPAEINNSCDSWESRIHPEDKIETFRILDEHLKNKTIYNPEYRMKMKSGEWRWFQSRGQALWDENGEAFRMVGSFRDIHERKIFQAALEESKKLAEVSKERLELCWKGAGDGMWDWDIETNEVILSDRWRELLGYAKYEIRNHFEEWKSRLHPDDKQRVLTTLKDHIKKKTPYKCEYRMKKKNGKWHWFQDRGQALWDQNDIAFRMAGSLRDINDYKISQKELEESKKLAEAANEAKTRFLANMSHEIRTPMNGIIGMTNLLLDTELNRKQKEYVDLILHSSENMMQIINDILDLSKIESGKIELEYVEFDFKKQCQNIVDLLSISAKEKGLKLKANYDEKLPQFVIGDYGRIRQILVNLVNNAIKFTQEGDIHIKVEREKEDGDHVDFKISVIDKGIGIPRDKINKIFNKFDQADVSTTRQFGGTGLGLSICKELASLMGGTVDATSVENEGSTFWLSLTLKKASKGFIENTHITPTNKKPKKLTLMNTHILLVEDNPVNQKFMIYALKKYDCIVAPASNGQEALSQYRKHKFDIILMDCHMPIMDGYDATREIRELEAKGNKKTPIVAITANALKTDRDKCINRGMDDYISKPFTKETLESILIKWIPKIKQITR